MNDADLEFAAPSGARFIPLYGKAAAGRVALVDEADYDAVAVRRWYVRQHKRVDGSAGAAYAEASAGGPGLLRMHRLLTGYPLTDHINRDGLDNRRVNLRPATKGQNNANSSKPARSASRFKGVVRTRTPGRWRAVIRYKGRTLSLGTYDSDADAARAYDIKALEFWGPYAGTNFPRSDYVLVGAA